MPAKPDGNAVRTQRTRARILDAGLQLFNELGEAHVTTGMIAGALGISPGNLYYHFRNKDQVVERLFERFEERIDVEPRASADALEAMEDLWLYLHLMLERIWEYRFLYRNLDDVLARNRRLRDRFNRILDRKEASIARLCEGLVASGAMRTSAAEIPTLARNVLVVATYWLNYQSLRARGPGHGDRGGSAADVGRGAYQVMALVAPYLVGGARRQLDALTRAYIDNP